MEWASKGTAALAASNASEAVLYFTRALIEHPYSPDYFTKRATAFTRLKPARNDLALKDAEYAVLLGQKRAKREKIQAGQQRRVVALYGLGRHADAKHVLETMKKWRRTGDGGKSDQMEHDMWMTKIEGKLKNQVEAAPTISEYPASELPSESSMRKWLERQVKDNRFDYDGAESNFLDASIEKEQDVDNDDEDVRAAKAEASRPTTISALQLIRQDFYQNNDNLIVTFYAKKVDPTKFVCSIEPTAVHFTFPRPEDPSVTYSFSANPLHALIEPTKSTSRVYGTKVELTLGKAEKGIKWPSLEAKDRPVNVALPNPYASKDNSNWDKKAAELTKKVQKDKKEGEDGAESDEDSEYGGGDKVDSFFKKLYAGADEDTRRAMMKSFTESNGTALSTNWSEVSKGHVDEVQSKSDQ